MYMATHFFFSSFIKVVFLFLVVGVLISYILYYLGQSTNYQNIIKNDYTYNTIKLVLLTTLCIAFVFYVYFIYFYFVYVLSVTNYSVFNKYVLLPITSADLYFFELEFSFDFFGVVILFLAYFVGIISVSALDTRLFWKNIKYVFSLNIFILIVFLYVLSNNLLLFFLFYEFLLIPSFLIVYFISPSRRAVQASLYFLIWTQVGSFLVLSVIAYIISFVGSSNFSVIAIYPFSYNEVFYIYLFLFLGFGFKVPIWPFHYWLTKTHVEAPAGFSMYLSGFLVKSAVYGFYKITNLLGADINTTIFSTICVVGIVDASLKMWGQTDLKKLVAYGTVQEMNLIYLAFCWGDTSAILGGILFCVTHGALSGLMFYLVDCIQRRFNSRSVVEISGVLQLTPNLGICIFIMCVLYSGLPGTLKFSCEFYIFAGLFEVSPTLTMLVFFVANVLGLIGFCKCWFNVLFGMNLKNPTKAPFDLNIKEFYIIGSCFLFLFLFTFFVNYYL